MIATMTARHPLTGPSVWNGRDMARSTRWIRAFPATAADALDRALQVAKARGLVWSQLTRDNFAIEGLQGLLDDIRGELEDGSGIVKLTGFPVARWSEDDLRLVYFGLGTHLGTPVFQNRSGELMRAIRDEGAHVGRTYGEVRDPTKGTTFLSSYARTLTNGGLRFHTDRTDVVGLLCVRQARRGGVSRLASTPAIHNALLATRPDLLDVLFEDFWRSRLGEESSDPATVYRLPIFGLRDGKFTSHYSLTFIEAAELVPGVPKITAPQRAAIAALQAAAEDLAFDMTLEPGDLQLINSHVTYHGRTPFEDDFDAGMNRLLLRLWLTMPGNRALPVGHEVLWREIEANRPRGGIIQGGIA